MKTKSKNLVLWVKQDDPLSERAKILAEKWHRVIPRHLGVKIKTVDPIEPQVSRVPCLNFMLGEEIVYTLEGDITLDSVLTALRRLG